MLESESTKIVPVSLFQETKINTFETFDGHSVPTNLPERAVPEVVETVAESVVSEAIVIESGLQESVVSELVPKNMMKMDANAEKELQDEMSPTEGYLCCLGQLQWSSEKLASLVGEEGGQNPIHLKSAYIELIDTCDKVVAMLGDTKKLGDCWTTCCTAPKQRMNLKCLRIIL